MAAGTTGMLLAYEDLMFDEDSNRFAAEYVHNKIATIVQDPDKVRKMTPAYPLGSRRMCSEIDFYATMAQPDIVLVDVREDPVLNVTSNAIITASATAMLPTSSCLPLGLMPASGRSRRSISAARQRVLVR